MTEPIEKWKKEARQYVESIPYSMDDWNASDVEKAYIAGKMSQPVVELPRLGDFQIATSLSYKKMLDSLTAAGINYRIKGE